MNEDLKKKLLSDLGQTGFYSEMQALDKFSNRKWDCSGGNTYIDHDQDKVREIDIVAMRFRNLLVNEKNRNWLLVGFYIIAEVKKSKSPWIVVTIYRQSR
jgi:hypothetical protein